MIRVLNFIGMFTLAFGIYRGVELYNMPLENSVVTVERKMAVKEQKKLEVPAPKPKSFDQQKISRMEMIESSDLVVEDHIISVLDTSRYSCLGQSPDEYAAAFSSAVLRHTGGDIKLALWLTAMAQVESSYRLNADPKISSARGFLQVIYKYHAKELSKAGISKDELAKNPSKSIYAGVLVFRKYLKVEHGNYKRATARYRGLSVPQSEQDHYYKAISKVYNKLLEDLKEYA